MALAARPAAGGATESEALSAMQARDPRRALGILMAAYGPELHRFCRDQLNDAEAAKDLLQVVFIQAFQSLHEYEPRSTLRAWLYGIARHRCLDAQKSRRRWSNVVEAREEPPDSVDHAPTGEDHASAADFRAALEECVQALSASSRETVLLRLRSELSYEEIAEMSGERIGTLRVRVARALPQLRACLEGKGVA